MDISPEHNEPILQDIWRQPSPQPGPGLNLCDPRLLPVPADSPPVDAGQAAEEFRRALGWPGWVRFYDKQSAALVAARKLAQARGLGPGVVWMAPGTGSPYPPPRGQRPGLAVLRADWTPDAEAMAAAQAQARAQGLLLVADESVSGFRLAPGGACQAFGLEPDLAIFGPSLTAGSLAILAGTGQAPPPGPAVDQGELAGLGSLLPTLVDPAFSQRLCDLGEALLQGLDYFCRQAGISDLLSHEGPPQMPRLCGRRLFAFRDLAAEEGLALGPLLYMRGDLGQKDLLAAWRCLARAAARLKALPPETTGPQGWKKAAESFSCGRVQEILARAQSGEEHE